jgi:alkylation response protein AidB-like acyl-CoA dehydrogenase
MDFRLDDEQLALQDAVRRFCGLRLPLDGAVERGGEALDRATWRELGDLGVLGLLVPETAGGAGLGVVHAAIVLEELGAHLAPGPVVWSVLSAPLLDSVGTGERVAAGLDTLPAGGEPILVPHAADLDVLVVLQPDGVVVCDRAELGAPEAMEPLDPATPVGRYAALPPGVPIGGPAEAARLQRVGTVLTAAVLVGVSATALETARTYALEREQFGVPIGSFQAVKHLLADMYVRTNLARSATLAAATLLDDGAGPEPDVGGPKILAGEAALRNARSAVQILGGMGYTWAMLPHLLLKRSWVLEHAFGTTDAHAAAAATRIAAEVA